MEYLKLTILVVLMSGSFSYQQVFLSTSAATLSNSSIGGREAGQQDSAPITLDISLHSWGQERGYYFERRPIELKCKYKNTTRSTQRLYLMHTSNRFPLPFPYPLGMRARVLDQNGKVLTLTETDEDGWWEGGVGFGPEPTEPVILEPGAEIVRIVSLGELLRGNPNIPEGLKTGTYTVQLSLGSIVSNPLEIAIKKAQETSGVVRFTISVDGEANRSGYYTKGKPIDVRCTFRNLSNSMQEVFLAENQTYTGSRRYPILLKARVSKGTGYVLTTNPIFQDGWYTSYIHSSRLFPASRSEDWLTIEPGGEVIRKISLDEVLRGNENLPEGLAPGIYRVQLSLGSLMSNTLEIVVK